MQLFAKKFYGFNPINIPVITFSQAGSRNRLLELSRPGDRILYVASKTEDTHDDAKGYILGMVEIGDGAVSAEDFIQNRSILRDSFFNEDGSYKWSEGIPMKRAWKFTPPIYRLNVIAKERVDSQATRQNAIILTEEEKNLILSQPHEELKLPEISTLINSYAKPYKKLSSKNSARIFGHISGIEIGASFLNRAELAQSGLHKPLVAGISGSAAEGADSIVVSGGYEDDEDLEDVIIYTGHGGNDPNTNKQISDQTFTRNNLALALNERLGLPIRVIRGAGGSRNTSPTKGYRYDGLFYVASHWQETGKSGFKVFRYRLEKEIKETSDKILPLPPGTVTPERMETTVLRLIRDTKVSRWVKNHHNFKCQVCGIILETDSGPYAEGAHIVPLGRPHNGQDSVENMLCLCPNHHVLFDKGSFSINNDMNLIGIDGYLRTLKGHEVSQEALALHRKRFGLE